MTTDMKTVLENLREDLEGEPSYKSSLDDFRIYLNVQGQRNKSKIWLHLYQQVYYLSEVMAESISEDIEEEVITNLKIDQTARDLAVEKTEIKTTDSGSISPQSKAKLEEKISDIRNNIDPENDDLHSSSDIRRAKQALSNQQISELIDFNEGVIKEREVINVINNSSPEDDIGEFLESFVSEFNEVFKSQDEQYKDHLDSVYKSLLKAYEESGELSNVLGKSKEIQAEWHNEARGWPDVQ